jgi:predicted Na+-dependent transporter
VAPFGPMTDEDFEVYLAQRRRRRRVLLISFGAAFVLAPVLAWLLEGMGLLPRDSMFGVILLEFLLAAGMVRAFMMRVTDRIYP